jgi:hypothetical protein
MPKKLEIKEIPAPDARTTQSNIDKMDEQEFAELQIESQAVVGELLKTYMTPDKCIDAFIRWVLPMWPAFWGRFYADGSMSWKDFEQFVQWENRWQGDTRRVFSILDPNSTGYINKPFVLEVKRKWHNRKDTAMHSIDNFKWQFAQRFSTLGRGWRLALDQNSTGHCAQLTFMRVCHEIGMNRNLKSLWRRLTKGDVSRSLVLRDLDPELDKMLKEFALRLVTLHSTLRQGWCAICRAGGGHLHENGFEQACVGLGMGANASKSLFAVLDPKQRRYLTEYDELDFLDIWNPGNQAGSAAAAAAAAAMTDGAGKPSAAQLGSSSMTTGKSPQLNLFGVDDDPTLPDLGNFEFELVLTRDEYSEYLRRRRGSRIRAGLQGPIVDVGAETRRKPPLGGKKPRPPSAPPKLGGSASKKALDKSASSGDLWHGLAPLTLGNGKQSLVRTAKSNTLGGKGASSLGKFLSCPASTG